VTCDSRDQGLNPPNARVGCGAQPRVKYVCFSFVNFFRFRFSFRADDVCKNMLPVWPSCLEFFLQCTLLIFQRKINENVEIVPLCLSTIVIKIFFAIILLSPRIEPVVCISVLLFFLPFAEIDFSFTTLVQVIGG
jgi:hypothetical protein